MNEELIREDNSTTEDRSEISETNFNCQFLPVSVLENIIERVSQHRKYVRKCTRSLIQLQSDALNYRKSTRSHMTWSVRYNVAINKAVHAQDWNKLLRLLKISPIWEHYDTCGTNLHYLDNYLKALILLLMYHPSAKSQSLMDDFLHMVLSLRSDEDKRAFMKVLIAMPNKLIPRYGSRKHGL